MFISALLTKFRTNPADFTAPPPAKCSFAMNEPLKEKIFPAVHSFQTVSWQSTDKQEYFQMASELGFSGIS